MYPFGPYAGGMIGAPGMFGGMYSGPMIGGPAGFGFNPWVVSPWAGFAGVPYTEVDFVLDDEDIEENVRDSIDLDPYIPRRDKNAITVDVNGGVAKLSGTVSNRRSQFLAFADAFWSAGVVDVDTSELKVEEKAVMPGRKMPEGGPAKAA